MAEKFSITRGSGYRMTFVNGWALSVQWGAFNYCERNDLNAAPDSEGFYSSPNAEVAVFKPNGSMARITEYESVLGWQTPDQVAALMGLVASGAFVEYSGVDEDEDEVHEPEDQSQGDVLGLYDERDYRRDKAREDKAEELLATKEMLKRIARGETHEFDAKKMQAALDKFRATSPFKPDDESGQDRESYSDDQDRESYYVEPDCTCDEGGSAGCPVHDVVVREQP